MYGCEIAPLSVKYCIANRDFSGMKTLNLNGILERVHTQRHFLLGETKRRTFRFKHFQEHNLARVAGEQGPEWFDCRGVERESVNAKEGARHHFRVGRN